MQCAHMHVGLLQLSLTTGISMKEGHGRRISSFLSVTDYT